MIFSNLNTTRVQYLIKGVIQDSPTVLVDFFSKNKRILILHGLRLDTIPKDIVKLIDLFIKLPEQSKSTAYSYFVIKNKANDVCTVEEAITTFLFNEYGIEELESKNIGKYCRCLLINLLSDHPKEQLIRFMSTEIAPSRPNITDANLIKSEKVESKNPIEMLPRLLSIINDHQFESPSELNDYELMTLLGVVDQSIYEKLKVEFLSRIDKLSLSKENYAPYIDYIDSKFTRATKSNFDIKKPSKFASTNGVDPTNYTSFGFISRVIEESGTLFIDPLSLIKDDKVIQLGVDDIKDLFPDRGNIMWLSKGHKRVLAEDQFGLFNISRKTDWIPNARSSKYIVDKLITPVFPVVNCDYSAKEFEKVRSWLASNQHNLSLTNSYVLLDKNTLIKPSFNVGMIIDFEKPMHIYNNAKIFITNRNYYVYEIGYSDTFLDLSSSEKYFRHLLKTGKINKGGLLDHDISDLISEFNSVRNGENALKISEITETLQNILDKDKLFSELLDELSKSEKVQISVNERVNDIVSKKISESSNLKLEIELLLSRKNKLEKDIKKEEDQQKKTKLGLSNEIKSVFEKGIEDGKRVLAEVTLFQAIMGSNQHAEKSSNDQLNSNKQISIFNEQKYYRSRNLKHDNITNIIDDLKALRFNGLKIERLFEALNNSLLIGLTPAFMGGSARILADAFVKSLSVARIDEYCIGPGTTYICELAENYSETNIDNKLCILLKDFDISPISIYGHDLVDLCYRKFLSGESNLGPIIVFTFEDSGLGLDYPEALKYSLAIVDTDQIDIEEFKIDLDEFSESIRENISIEPKNKKAILNLIRSISVYPGVDDHENLMFLLGFLQKTYFNRYI